MYGRKALLLSYLQMPTLNLCSGLTYCENMDPPKAPRCLSRRLKRLLVTIIFLHSWLPGTGEMGFMKRHGLSIRTRTRQGQVSLADAEYIAINFAIDVQQKVLELRVTKLFNAEQTGKLGYIYLFEFLTCRYFC
ncbi:hypothetical protein JG687_00012059 [Phytophthora cactorum]|uniref:Uncharacterized protein n=1 Tax=Phytophthora cactorum TaxID=29920 RepID=A0A8T1U6L6_9STRA|nr:hypothetical protein JG687_00012059 [Phytophthora cactorum]